MWNAAYLYLGALPDYHDAILYSVSAMTTYGHASMHSDKRWQLLGALEELDGMLLFGLTTAFLFGIIQKIHELKTAGPLRHCVAGAPMQFRAGNTPSIMIYGGIVLTANPGHTVPRVFFLALTGLVFVLILSCGKKEASPTAGEAAASSADQQQGTATTSAPAVAHAPEDPPPPPNNLLLPVGITRRTGDLDEIKKSRNLRALVIMSPISFFYDKGMPKGISYEALDELQRFANQKLKLGKLDLKITFLPTSPSQLEASLTEGLGDLIAYGIVVTPEREKRVAFSTPIQTNITQVVVGGPKLGPVSSLQDLSAKEVYLNPLTVNYETVRKLSDSFKQAGKPPINLVAADKNLTDDDIIQMVNAGLVASTVVSKQRADLWSQVLEHLTPYPQLVISSGGQSAWVMRKNNPQLKELVDEFAQRHGLGTSFGNTLLRRYLQNAKWIKNSTSAEEMKKFQSTVATFQKYSGEYSFDYLMLAAQGYQESLLDQSRKNPSGAVGMMQVIPKYAAASPINVPDITTTDGNIHAGAKILRNIADTYFNDPKIDQVNRTLFAFASYNAGPNRIVKLQKDAKDMGLDPNVWFGNVELVAAKEIGQETVTYVGNIYKYYIAYKLAIEQGQVKEKAKSSVPAS